MLSFLIGYNVFSETVRVTVPLMVFHGDPIGTSCASFCWEKNHEKGKNMEE